MQPSDSDDSDVTAPLDQGPANDRRQRPRPRRDSDPGLDPIQWAVFKDMLSCRDRDIRKCQERLARLESSTILRPQNPLEAMVATLVLGLLCAWLAVGIKAFFM